MDDLRKKTARAVFVEFAIELTIDAFPSRFRHGLYKTVPSYSKLLRAICQGESFDANWIWSRVHTGERPNEPATAAVAASRGGLRNAILNTEESKVVVITEILPLLTYFSYVT